MSASLQLSVVPAGGGRDRTSALSDDLLLLILARLGGCVSAAARTSVLARRWRGLWTGLTAVAFRGVALGSLEAALARLARPPPRPSSPAGGALLRSLDIRVPVGRPKPRRRRGCRLLRDAPGVYSLMCAVAPLLLSLEEYVLAIPSELEIGFMDLDLTGSPSLTSIELDSLFFQICASPAGESFAALTTLTLSVCTVDLDALLPRCPRLRVLNITIFWGSTHDYTVHSATLQELVVTTECSRANRVDIATPVLEQLTMSFHIGNAGELDLSVLAPMVEKVSWYCRYGRWIVHGRWVLTDVSTRTPGTLNVHVLIDGRNHPDYATNIGQEVEKHLQVCGDLSVLELRLKSFGHVFGALVVHLLGVNRICTAIQRFKVVILKPEVHELDDKDECEGNCGCQPMTNWRSETISLPHLEEVEIEGLEGVEDHELDFLELMLRCAPMLRTMAAKLSDEVSPTNGWSTKIRSIFEAYPHVECHMHGLDLDETEEELTLNGNSKRLGKFIDDKNKKPKTSQVIQQQMTKIGDTAERTQSSSESFIKSDEATSVSAVMDLVVECGAAIGTDEYFIASELFVKREQREMFLHMTEGPAQFDWLRRKYNNKYGR